MTLVDGAWLIQEGNDLWKCLPKSVVSLKWQIPAQRKFVDTLAPVDDFFKIFRKRWADVCIEVVQFSAFNLLQPFGSHNYCRDIVAVSSVVDLAVAPTDFVGVFRRGLDVQVLTSDSSSSSSSCHPYPIYPNYSFSQRHLDTLTSPNPSISTYSRILFTTDDIPLGDATTDDQILMPSALPALDFAESLVQLRTSVTQLSIKQLRTTNSIGDLKNELLSMIDNIEKAAAEARTQQDQVFRGLIKSVGLEVQIQKTALSLEMLEFKKGVRAHCAIVTTDFADIRKEVKGQKADLSKEFDDRLAAIRNDLLEFRVETQEQYTTLRDNLAELIALFNRGRVEK
ncbi:golgin subfamily B member 1-like [Dorcoceras hygrometricum]|uniref:Golgin subfamily B member 1-like n=1 Tax=Dorcoceras hygrometricum TaxID=472368 RepID=A0A2Z7CK18_9LAMI|nr:golgin subfamily B member 1-like [Dorcoceras hygrometricum]